MYFNEEKDTEYRSAQSNRPEDKGPTSKKAPSRKTSSGKKPAKKSSTTKNESSKELDEAKQLLEEALIILDRNQYNGHYRGCPGARGTASCVCKGRQGKQISAKIHEYLQ